MCQDNNVALRIKVDHNKGNKYTYLVSSYSFKVFITNISMGSIDVNSSLPGLFSFYAQLLSSVEI